MAEKKKESLTAEEEVQALLKRYGDTVTSLAKAGLQERIKTASATVNKILDDSQRQIVLGLVGFDGRWGRLEVDNTNGRMSTASQQFAAAHAAAVTAWLNQFKEMPTLTDKEVKDIQTNYRDNLIRKLQAAVYNKAEREATQMIDQVLEAKITQPVETMHNVELSKQNTQLAIDAAVRKAVQDTERRVKEEFRLAAEAKVKEEADRLAKLEEEARNRDHDSRALTTEL